MSLSWGLGEAPCLGWKTSSEWKGNRSVCSEVLGWGDIKDAGVWAAMLNFQAICLLKIYLAIQMIPFTGSLCKRRWGSAQEHPALSPSNPSGSRGLNWAMTLHGVREMEGMRSPCCRWSRGSFHRRGSSSLDEKLSNRKEDSSLYRPATLWLRESIRMCSASPPTQHFRLCQCGVELLMG